MALVSNLHMVFGIFGCAAGLFFFLAPTITLKRIFAKKSIEQFSLIPYPLTVLHCLLFAWMKDNEAQNINGPVDISSPTSAWSSFESFVTESIETENFMNYIAILFVSLGWIVRNKGRWCRGLESAALCLVLSYSLWVVAKLFKSFEVMELSIFFLFLVMLILAYVSLYGFLYPEDEDENESNREQLERLLLIPQAEASTTEQPTVAEKK